MIRNLLGDFLRVKSHKQEALKTA